MEYSIYITYNCNLRCPFCYVRKKLSRKRREISSKKISQVVKYIASNNKKGDWVVFFGGEPLLALPAIEKVISKFKKTKINFAIYTNGLLLNKLPEKILKKIAVILVSADGDKKAQDKYRGKGSYQRVLKNIDSTKLKTNALIVGRMTVDQKTDLYASAKNLLNHTGMVHWQIANIPNFKNPQKFVKNYKAGLEKLFNYWLVNFKRGKNLEMIPFQAVISSLIFNYPKNKSSFRCGVGKQVQVIDIDGKVYWCDELVGNKKALIGNVTDERVKNNYRTHYEIFEDCKLCNVSEICRGRCRKCLEVYTPEHNRIYCEMTKFLISVIEKRKKEIIKIIKKKGLTLNKFYKIRYLTEEIP